MRLKRSTSGYDGDDERDLMLSLLASGVYIGGGAVVLILIIVVIVLLMRR